MKYPHVQQHDEKDCGAACISMISEYYGRKLTMANCRKLIKVDNRGANFYGIVKGANEIGLNAEALIGSKEELIESIKNDEIVFPIIARIINNFGFEHYIVVYSMDSRKATVGDPGKTRISKIPCETFFEQWQGQIITFTPKKDFVRNNDRKGSLSKFFKYIMNQKKSFTLVFVLSLFITLVNLSGSLVFTYVVNNAFMMSNSSTSNGELESQHIDEEHSEIDHESNSSVDSKLVQIVEQLDTKLNIVFENINIVCVFVIILYILRSFVMMIRSYILAFVTKKIDVSLTLGYFNHFVKLPIEFYGTRRTGEFMSRFNDTRSIRNVISNATITLMLDSIMAIGCGGLLYYINRKLFIITFGILVIYTFVMYFFKNPLRNINHQIMENEAQVTSYLKESIDGIETIKSFQYEKTTTHKTEAMYTKFIDKNVKGSIIYAFQETIISTMESIGIVVLIWTGAYLCVDNIITIADLMTFYYLLGYFLTPVKNLINLQPELQNAIVAAERLNDILDVDVEDDSADEIDSMYGNIKINNLVFRYGYRDEVLRCLNMEFQKGKKIAIVGESGCGKTTLIKLLMAFYKPECGSITINDVDIFKYRPSSIRKHIAYISQDVFLFSDTIKNNIKLGNENATDEEIQNVCKMCFADNFINELPNGYDTIIEENGNNLSGGQKQRIAIARALLKKPDILIMDEATSNLDNITEESIKNMIHSLSGDITCIIIAHRLKTVKNCDYIFVMEKGMVIEEGTHDELIKKEVHIIKTGYNERVKKISVN